MATINGAEAYDLALEYMRETGRIPEGDAPPKRLVDDDVRLRLAVRENATVPRAWFWKWVAEKYKAVVDAWGYTEEGEPLTPEKQVWIIIPPGPDGRDADAVLTQVGRPVGLLDAVEGVTYSREELVRAWLERMKQGETGDRERQ